MEHYDAFVRVWLDGVLWFEGDGDGERNSDRVLEIEVDERSNDLTSFRLSLDLAPTDDNDWDLLANPSYDLLHRVTIAFGVAPQGREEPSTLDVVCDGYVTAVEPIFGAARVPDSSLELSGLDASCLMHLEERTRQWKNMTDAAIVRQIYGEYGFGVDANSVEETAPTRHEERAMMIQRCTDAEFIRLLARRNGFEAYVQARSAKVHAGAGISSELVGHFRRPNVADTPQPELTVMPQEAPRLIEFRARWTSHQPTTIRARHIDERTRRIRSAEVTAPRLKRLGNQSRADILADRIPKIVPRRAKMKAVGLQLADAPHDATEVEGLALAHHQEADWLVEATGTVEGVRYPAILRARRPVKLSGAGTRLDGTWYVRGARHRWIWDKTAKRYEVDADLVRNALTALPGGQ